MLTKHNVMGVCEYLANLLVSGPTLQRQNAEYLKLIFPEKEYWGLSPNFHIHVSESELYIPTMGLAACSAGGNM